MERLVGNTGWCFVFSWWKKFIELEKLCVWVFLILNIPLMTSLIYKLHENKGVFNWSGKNAQLLYFMEFEVLGCCLVFWMRFWYKQRMGNASQRINYFLNFIVVVRKVTTLGPIPTAHLSWMNTGKVLRTSCVVVFHDTPLFGEIEYFP